MKKYCNNCGKELMDNAKFCPGCGAPVTNAAVNVKNNTVTKDHSKSRNIKIIIVVVVLLIITAGAGLFIWHQKTMEESKADTSISTGLAKQLSSEKESADKKPQKESTIDKTQKILSEKLGVDKDVVASTLGHSEDGFLALVRDNGSYNFIIDDKKNDRIAEVPFSLKTYNFAQQKYDNSDMREPAVFKMSVYQDEQDKDVKLGQWFGKKHIIPIHALFNLDQYGNVLPGMLNSGWGPNPIHYHSYLQEQKNVDMVNIFLTEMKTLHKYVDDNKVSIPVTN